MNRCQPLPLFIRKWRGVVTMVLMAFSIGMQAQNQLGFNLSVAVEKDFTKRFDGEFTVDTRFQDIDSKGYMECFSVGAGLGYKIIDTKKFDLKASAEFEYLRMHNPIEKEFTTKNKLKVTDQRNFNRTRTSVGLGASFKPNKRWNFLLKETVQYNHHATHSATVLKFDPKMNDGEYFYDYNENASWSDNVESADDEEPKTFESKDRFVLRNKLTIKYNIRHSIFSPYVSGDYGCGLNYSTNKWKFTAGTEIEFSKLHNLDVFYRYQTEDDDDEPNGHLIGVGYILKF